MNKFKKPDNSISLTIDTKRMNPLQIKLLKKICQAANQTLMAFGEGEYFESGAEMMKLASEIIQSSSYNEMQTQNEEIPYKQQALEYAMDVFQDSIEEQEITKDEF